MLDCARSSDDLAGTGTILWRNGASEKRVVDRLSDVLDNMHDLNFVVYAVLFASIQQGYSCDRWF